MKEDKASGIDKIQTEIIKHFGHNAHEWMLKVFN